MPIATLRAMSLEAAAKFEWFDRVGFSIDMQRLRGEFPEIQWTGFEAWAKSQSWDALLTGPEAHPF
jgi:hypothetical protein